MLLVDMLKGPKIAVCGRLWGPGHFWAGDQKAGWRKGVDERQTGLDGCGL